MRQRHRLYVRRARDKFTRRVHGTTGKIGRREEARIRTQSLRKIREPSHGTTKAERKAKAEAYQAKRALEDQHVEKAINEWCNQVHEQFKKQTEKVPLIGAVRRAAQTTQARITLPPDALGKFRLGDKLKLEGENGGVYEVIGVEEATNEVTIAGHGGVPAPCNMQVICMDELEEDWGGIDLTFDEHHRFFDVKPKRQNLTRPQADWKVT